MRIIKDTEIIEAVEKLFIEANTLIPNDINTKIAEEISKQTSDLSRGVIDTILKNNAVSAQKNIPICQDTGMAVLFIEIGNLVQIDTTYSSLQEIVDVGVARAYQNGYLRLSVVADPLRRKNTNDNTPSVLYTDIVAGDKIKITALPKGFGSENMSKNKMFTPNTTRDEIIDFVVDTVKSAGSNPCPPIVVGVGIGGTFDYSAVLAKKALSRSIDDHNDDEFYAQMERDCLEKINMLDIGVQGLGGPTTALAVNIETYPTHIAGLPVSVNISCHVTRHKTTII
jgi:fumarate hydratase subunit alpha